MKGVVFFCLLAFTAAALTIPKKELNQKPEPGKKSFPKSCLPWSRISAVTNLRENNKPVTIWDDPRCSAYIAEDQTNIDDRNKLYNYRGYTCNLAIASDSRRASKEVWVHKPGVVPRDARACDPNEDTEAFYLPQDVDKNTYMILDSANAHWFFTAQLGGCDIFVATSDIAANRNMPLIIHANANSRTDTPTENLQVKGDGANTIIGSHGNGYDIKARVYRERDGDEAYWASYRADVKKYRYNTVTPTLQQFYFFGYFDGTAWRFYLKARFTGQVTNITL